jgi:hypothetical protein
MNTLANSEKIQIINDTFINLIEKINKVYKYHETLSKIDSYLDKLKTDLESNNLSIINSITNNCLAYLEPIKEKNYDFFVCQKKYSKKKDGKIIKNKVTYLIGKIMLKEVLVEHNTELNDTIFVTLADIFKLLLKDDKTSFDDSYVKYVKEHYNTSRNYNKMLMVMDNIEDILGDDIMEEIEQDDSSDSSDAEDDDENAIEDVTEDATEDAIEGATEGGTEDAAQGTTDDADKSTSESKTSTKASAKAKAKAKSNKKSKKSKKPEEGFFKNLENSNIAKLAKNISEKINPEDFPELNDPSKLLSGLTNPDTLNGGGGLGNLLKFVVSEVETAIKSNNMQENDLVNEAQNLMGGMDPSSLLSGNGLGNIFGDLLSGMAGGNSNKKSSKNKKH